MASVEGSSDALSLNLTPMLDIFSILVCFLLMSYSTDPVNHDVDKNIELPSSVTMVNLDEVPTIAVTKDAILVNEQKIADVIGGDVAEKDRDQGAIRPLYEVLKKMASQNKKVQARLGKEEKESKPALSLEMHQDHNFKLIKRIMLSAEQADYIKFKLLVAKNEAG